MKSFFSTNIKKEALKNNFFRKVLATKANAQVVVMSLKSKEDIGMEIHKKYDQILVNTGGKGIYIINGKKGKFEENFLVYVPKGSWHNFINTGKTKLKLFTIYSPPNHKPGTIHKTKKDAEKAEKLKHD
ncbi:MAG: cupin domain-containing protein [Candidatus Pacearchaeota archaeon]|nr:cupin domain-containing protein [Candidatus Pacearchaeota archaeon]